MSQPAAKISDPPTIEVRGPHSPPGRAVSDLTVPFVLPRFLAFPGHPCSRGDAEGLLRGGRAERLSERGVQAPLIPLCQAHGALSKKKEKKSVPLGPTPLLPFSHFLRVGKSSSDFPSIMRFFCLEVKC